MDAVGERRNRASQEPLQHGRFTSSLLRKVVAGEAEGWRRLTVAIARYIRESTQETGVPSRDWEDLAQDVCIQIVRSLDRFRGEHGAESLRAWIHSVARHKIADYFRVACRHPEGVPVGGSGADLKQVADRHGGTADFDADDGTDDGKMRILHAAMGLVRAVVAPHSWQAFVRVALEGRHVGEVASELRTTPHAVSQSIYRVRRRLVQVAKDLDAARDSRELTAIPHFWEKSG